MKDPSSDAAPPAAKEDEDLLRRIARYRKRLQHEGRVNAIKVLDSSLPHGSGLAEPEPRSRS